MSAVAASVVFGQIDRELWLVTARAGPHRSGLVATFVSRASIVEELPRVLVGLARHHYTWELIEACGAFALHLIGEDHLSWVWRFGLRSGRALDKFEGIATHKGQTGSPILTDALGWLDCRIEARLDTGDRIVYLAEVVDAYVTSTGAPLTFNRLMQLAAADELAELKSQRERDAAVDAAAIRAWRRRGE